MNKVKRLPPEVRFRALEEAFKPGEQFTTKQAAEVLGLSVVSGRHVVDKLVAKGRISLVTRGGGRYFSTYSISAPSVTKADSQVAKVKDKMQSDIKIAEASKLLFNGQVGQNPLLFIQWVELTREMMRG